MTVLVVIWCYLVLWFVGSMALAAMGISTRGVESRTFAELAAGVSLLAVLGMTTMVAGGTVTLPLTYGIFALVTAAGLARSRPSLRGGIRLPRAWRAQALLVATVMLLLVLTVGASRDWLQWDAWAFWTLKARAIFLHGRLPEALLTLDGPYPWTHPEYPLALPLVDWWLFAHAGRPNPALASLGGVIWLTLLPLLLWRAVRGVAGEVWAGVAALGAVAFWPISILAVGGHAEIILTLSILGAVYELSAGLEREDGGSVARYALFLTLAALSKNEGLAIAVVAVAVALLELRRGQRLQLRTAIWLTMPFLALAPWFLFARLSGIGAEHIGDPPGLAETLWRVPLLMGTFFDLVTTRAWIPLPLLLACGLVARFSRKRPDAGAAWGLILGYFLVTQVVYLLTPLDLAWLVINSYFRIIGVMVPAVVFLCIREIFMLEREGRSVESRVGAFEVRA